MNWTQLLDESALATLLPDEFAHFARPVKDGLTVFLEGLPESHQSEILSKQAKLPLTASISERLGLLAQSCPVLQKLGQILARDQRLSDELRKQLRQLESLPASVPLEAIQEILAQELGDLGRLGVTLMPPAIAEASVAVVIPFQKDGGKQGVFKVLKPGIEQRLELELGLLEQVGAHLDQRCDELQIPHLDYEQSFQQVKEKLSEEIRLDHEQQHLVKAREFYADETRVLIPAIFDCCTPRVTAMERIEGCKVTDHALDGRKNKRRLAKLVIQAMIARPIFSRDCNALFHSDPHAGNLFYTNDGRLAILDWSLVGTLDEQERVAIVQIILGALTLDTKRIVDVLQQFADQQRLDQPALKLVIQSWVRRIRHGHLPGITWLVGMLDDAVQNARLRVGTDMMLFRKSLHTLEGVLTEVGATRYQIDEVLCVEFLRHFAMEWPRRWFTLPNSRQFATRLSNLDLTKTMLSGPATTARFWTDHALDALAACRENTASSAGRTEPA